MDKRTLSLVLAIVALGCIGYGIYRSIPERITIIENGNEVVYGDPQHGLILGLMLVASVCIGAIVYMTTRKVGEKQVHQTLRSEPPVVNNPTTQSSYRPLS